MKDYKELIGQPIEKCRQMLGWWWVLTHCDPIRSTYVFERAASARIEVQTKDNIVKSESHNQLAEIYLSIF